MEDDISRNLSQNWRKSGRVRREKERGGWCFVVGVFIVIFCMAHGSDEVVMICGSRTHSVKLLSS